MATIQVCLVENSDVEIHRGSDLGLFYGNRTDKNNNKNKNKNKNDKNNNKKTVITIGEVNDRNYQSSRVFNEIRL